MKLKSVKLSGFKSFVDPTTVSFPSQLTSIVGPNGCGKSNIIDAVRWVLGESSAKNLRSVKMSEVVFNGSASRKAVSRASVELFFDNVDGRIGGEFSNYSEISVRRTLDLEGQSNYYLNGTSCRKRDIKDVFLGTGLGPKNYAIIEQGMISKLVSSKPEEMRSYIEEVAGISRYLDRRKETESRIKRTRENLSRIEDLRGEMDRLLFKLKRQAKAAGKYTELRKEENSQEGLLKASLWKSKRDEMSAKEEKVRRQEIKLEEAKAVKSSSDSEIESYRAKQMDLQSKMDIIQEEFYSKGADITRVEQDRNLNKEKLKDLEERLLEKHESLESKKKTLSTLVIEKQEVDELMSSIAPTLEELRSEELSQDLKEESSERNLSEIEEEWNQFTLKMSSLIQEVEKIQEEFSINLKNLSKQRLEEIDLSLKQLKETISGLSSQPNLLAKKTNKLFLSLSEENKQQRKTLLEKTSEFTDLQSKLTTISYKSRHLENEIEVLEEEIGFLKESVLSTSKPLQDSNKLLEKMLNERLSVENSLNESRKSSEKFSQSILRVEKEKLEREQTVMTLREELEECRLDYQTSKVEAETIVKQIKEKGQDLDELLAVLPEDTDSDEIKNVLETILRKISRLGAINLAAMEEYSQEEERKQHLDTQYEELTKALETLQNAIKKIDKETKTTFKDTFDKLNLSLATSFPKLFGGGHAELIILGEDLLTSGVSISARPPGKRNSTVDQLSGGEKALAAIALVFAFFDLNPAPFCMLDEVDAPLDDLNTMRFISLVKELSESVQFVNITHNKISMEKSKNLTGVTMQEPGVSRIVAVDVEEAVQMAASQVNV